MARWKTCCFWKNRKGKFIEFVFVITCLMTLLFGIINHRWSFFILQGMKVVKAVEANPTGAQDRPKKEVLIKDCGELEVTEPFAVEKADAVDEE